MKTRNCSRHCANIKNIAVIAALALLAACGKGKGGNNGEKLAAKGVKAQIEAQLTEEKEPKCKVSISLASLGKSEAGKRIDSTVVEQLFTFQDVPMQQAADSFVSLYAENYKNVYATFYKEETSSDAKEKYNFVYEVEGKTSEGYKNTLQYHIHSNIYEGGSHAMQTDLTLNFNAKTGGKITLKELLQQGKERELGEKLLEQLLKDKGKKSLEELKEDGYLQNSDLYPTDNFQLGSDGITFLYNPYEIAGYEKGKTEITLSYDDIKDLLSKDFK